MKTFVPIIFAASLFFQPLFALAEVESKTNPTDVNDHTPEFSAIYNDQNGGDYATWYRIQVSTSSLGHWAHAKWDSGTTTMATTTESNRSPQISYGGSLLASSTTYYWRIRFSDDDRKEGAWSTATSTFYIDTSCNCATTTVYYIHTDHLSGSNVTTNDSGQLVQTLDYYPFGSIRVNKLRADGLDEKRKFTGYEHDYSTRLNYAGARYQNPSQGRFVSQDPVFQGSPEKFLEDPQSLNSYTYARNNPLILIDPSGKSWITFGQGFAESIAITAAAGALILAAPVALPAAAVTTLAIGGLALTGYGTYTNYQSYVSGEISKDQFDYNAGRLLGPLAVGAVVDVAGKTGLVQTSQSTPSEIKSAYERPANATTAAQRESVQGKPCVTCGKVEHKMYADHKTPLVKEYYQRGSIDATQMRSVDSVQPQCSSCSNKQGGDLSNYSKGMKQKLGL